MKLRDYQEQVVSILFDNLLTYKDSSPIAVLPTGAGKSICIAEFINRFHQRWSSLKFLVLSHVGEIIEQNYNKIVDNFNHISAGIYCASMGRKELNNDVIFASIQSLYNSLEQIGIINIIIIDECHLVNFDENSMYRKTINAIREINPKCRIVGFTATPYRNDCSLLTEHNERIFDQIAIEIPMLSLIHENYLSPLINKISKNEVDVSKISKQNNDYKMDEAQIVMMKGDINDNITKNILEYGKDRKRWLLFCCNIEHATIVSEKLNNEYRKNYLQNPPLDNPPCFCITGKTPKEERRNIISYFKNETNYKLAITNCNVLTTGFDAPPVDFIVLLRPTQSIVLYIQMLGRGTRLASNKENCLVLDYAGNIDRFGPVNLITSNTAVKIKKSKKNCRRCPECEEGLNYNAKECSACGYVFPVKKRSLSEQLTDELSNNAILSENNSFWFKIKKIEYKSHKKPGKIPSMRVSYSNGIITHNEWICLEHEGYAKQKAISWWKQRASGSVPNTIDEAVSKSFSLIEPKEIKLQKDGKYWKIINYNFNKGIDYAIC